MDHSDKLIMFEINKKSMLVAYILWFFLGYFGAHRFYTNNYLSATIQLCMCLIVIFFVFSASPVLANIALACIIILPIWYLLDIILTYKNVKDRNLKIATSLK